MLSEAYIIIIIIYPLTARVVGAPTFLHCSLFSTALWDLANSRPVHSLMLSSHLFLCLPSLLPLFTVPCKMVLARPDELETWPYHCSLRLFTVVRWSSCGPVACWILARTSSLVTWSLSYYSQTHTHKHTQESELSLSSAKPEYSLCSPRCVWRSRNLPLLLLLSLPLTLESSEAFERLPF